MKALNELDDYLIRFERAFEVRQEQRSDTSKNFIGLVYMSV